MLMVVQRGLSGSHDNDVDQFTVCTGLLCFAFGTLMREVDQVFCGRVVAFFYGRSMLECLVSFMLMCLFQAIPGGICPLLTRLTTSSCSQRETITAPLLISRLACGQLLARQAARSGSDLVLAATLAGSSARLEAYSAPCAVGHIFVG